MKTLIIIAVLVLISNAEVYEKFFENYKPNATLDDVTFTLHNRKNGHKGIQMFLGDKESIRAAGFDGNLPVFVATHGFLSNPTNFFMRSLRSAVLNQSDCNFIAVDWSAFSRNILYEEVVISVKSIGVHISKFLKFLVDETKINVKDLHVLGFSMGAHVMSFASDQFQGEKVGRITGFDPAGPIFEHFQPSDRLDPSDGDFVDVYHTSTFYPGMRIPAGTVDFYPNGGIHQPGCATLDFNCKHHMSHRYFVHTIKTGKDYEAVRCNSLKDAEGGNCDGVKAPMGIGAIFAKPGIYYINVTLTPNSN